jgi:hypothetical protein
MGRRAIDIDDNLFMVAFSVFRRNWMPCMAAVFLLLAANASVGFVSEPLAFAVLRALILMIAGYSAYRCLVTGGAVAGWRAVPAAEGRIPWRYAGVMLIILSPILVLGIVWTAPGSADGPSGFGEIVLGVALVVVYAALYVLLGTALPAVAEHGEAALADAFERGRRNYRAIGRSLVLGVWLFRAGSVLVMIGLSQAGVTTDFSAPGGGAFNVAAVGPMLLFNASHVFAECLNAVVLVRAYRRIPVVPEEAAAA